MRPAQALLDEIFRSKVRQAQQLAPEDRLRASFEHSEAVLEMMRAGIRAQHPEATDVEVEQILIDRVRIAKRIQERR